jgi:hypothetical protein
MWWSGGSLPSRDTQDFSTIQGDHGHATSRHFNLKTDLGLWLLVPSRTLTDGRGWMSNLTGYGRTDVSRIY